jgi:hypothetical protein
MIRGDEHLIDFFGRQGARYDMRNDRLSAQVEQRLAGQTGRSETSRNDGDNGHGGFFPTTGWGRAYPLWPLGVKVN